ncbi:TPA: hypothetical protein DCL28_03830 [Candidatus Komeilibacteria bacterium]|nr:MAG: hypothetical protein A2260_02765 [Candidatus Komeilibacteria bacterium RIFOXYA2_FULL_45_9]HAH04653.1 hypothetical protein [Candidatus Komeilibacteria bacterium]
MKLSGAAKAKAMDFAADEFSLKLSGASRSELNLVLKNLYLDLAGGSRATLTGQAKNITAQLSGASKTQAFDFFAQNAELDLAGASNVEVSVSENLKVKASGDSQVYLRGEPKMETSLSGASRVYQVDDDSLNSRQPEAL